MGREGGGVGGKGGLFAFGQKCQDFGLFWAILAGEVGGQEEHLYNALLFTIIRVTNAWPYSHRNTTGNNIGVIHTIYIKLQ